MYKEGKFYLALLLIMVCLVCAVIFYIDARPVGKSMGDRLTYKTGSLIFMSIALAPIIPLFFFAKKNIPDQFVNWKDRDSARLFVQLAGVAIFFTGFFTSVEMILISLLFLGLSFVFYLRSLY